MQNGSTALRMSHYEELTVTEAFEREYGGMSAEQLRAEIRITDMADHMRHTAEMLLETAELQRQAAKEPFLNPHNVQTIRRVYDRRA